MLPRREQAIVAMVSEGRPVTARGVAMDAIVWDES